MIGLECLNAAVAISERSDIKQAFFRKVTSSYNFGPRVVGNELRLQFFFAFNFPSKVYYHCELRASYIMLSLISNCSELKDSETLKGNIFLTKDCSLGMVTVSCFTA